MMTDDAHLSTRRDPAHQIEFRYDYKCSPKDILEQPRRSLSTNDHFSFFYIGKYTTTVVYYTIILFPGVLERHITENKFSVYF